MKKLSEKHKKRISESCKKVVHTKKWNLRVSNATKGKPKHSEESKLKIGLASRGHIPWNKCKKTGIVPKTAWKKGQNAMENNYSWKGGKSFEPYSVDWTKTLKRSIRERDRYVCQLCGKEPSTSVHHIDYNKNNCNPNNLITLCKPCHQKTNFKRSKWIKHFNLL